MIRSRKSSVFYSSKSAVPNKSPAILLPNYSLAKTASHVAVYVPFYIAEHNVNFVDKKETPITNVSLGFDTTKPKFVDMTGTGKGEDIIAFEHPFKVR